MADLTLSWTRRDRFGRWWALPLSDAPLSFDVDIIDHTSSPRTVKRTLTTGTTHVVYTHAQQITDFGAPVTALHFAIYQKSPIIGRGTPLIATLEV